MDANDINRHFPSDVSKGGHRFRLVTPDTKRQIVCRTELAIIAKKIRLVTGCVMQGVLLHIFG